MIIGISGRANSGKDTVGKIWNCLNNNWTNGLIFTFLKKYSDDFIKYINSDNLCEVKKFATNVKKIACILTGCTMEQLEDHDFKSSKLGNNWKKWIVTVSNLKTHELSFKDFYNKCDALNYKNIINNDQNINDLVISVEEIDMTYRDLLIKIGNDWGRNDLHQDTWVNGLMKNYKPDKDFKKYPYWIITDVRYPNEVKAIEDRDGIVIRLTRNTDNLTSESETALDHYKFRYIIPNDKNTSLASLINMVRDVYKQVNYDRTGN